VVVSSDAFGFPFATLDIDRQELDSLGCVE